MRFAARELFSNARGRKAVSVALCLLLILSMALLPAAFAPQPAEADPGGLVVAIDIGHGRDPQSGAYDPGASGNGVEEAAANQRIAQACIDELRTYYGVKVVTTSQYAGSNSIERRVKSVDGQGVDVVISIHCNSASASADGSEVWIPNDSAYLYNETHVAGQNLGNSILKNLNALGFKNRGTKTRNCTDGEHYPSPGGICDWYGINYWSRWAKIPGIIIEHGFVTNSSDAAKLGDASWCKRIGVADATGIAQYYGLSKDAPDPVDPNLEKTGPEVSTKIETTYENDPVIMGASSASVERMVSWYNSKNKKYPTDVYAKYGAATINDFCKIVSEEAAAEGVRAEVVFAQAMTETGWLQFGGDVKASQCNFCGPGATGNGVPGEDFSSKGEDAVRTGIRAQVQHLKAYASKDKLKNSCVDPRFDKVSPRGCAPTVKGLTGTWATSQTYGDDLTKRINELLGTSSKATSVKFSLADVPSSLAKSGAVAYVDGVAKPLTAQGGYGFVEVEGSGAHSVVLYEFNSNSADPHAVYPTHMYVWTVTEKGGSYIAKRYYGFNDLLRYAGSSIRITGKKGIRMITGMASGTKSALANGGVLGYTVVETGTLLAWSDRVENGSLTFDTPGVSRGKAYVAGKQDPVFNKSNGVANYTNVLVGFSSADQYKRDMAMRSYAILKDSSGNQLVVYGGTVQRSIGYIAEQNASAFNPGTSAYDFVHGIINACKG